MKKKYTIIKYRIFNKEFKKIKDFKAIVESDNINKFIEFLDGGNRIVIYDEIREAEEDDLIRRMLLKVKDNLQDELF